MDTISLQQTCRCCTNPILEADQFCPTCGFPLKGSEVDQQQFIHNRDYKKMELDGFQKKIKNAGTTLYVIAGLFVLMGFIYLMTNTELGTAVMIQQLILAAIFVGLGVWSKTKPVAAIITGLVIYALFNIMMIIAEPENIIRGIIVKVIIIVYLIKGLNSAMEAEKIRKHYNLT